MSIEIPLRNRGGETVACAVVDDDRADLAALRWYRLPPPSDYVARGYRVSNGHRGLLYLHRVVLGLEYGDPREGDHKDGNKLDCRDGNLRILPPGANSQNRGSQVGSSSRYRGVTRRGRRWEAQVRVNNDLRYLGTYDDEDEAGRVAAAYRTEHMPYAIDR